jgi:hypothetical protein
MSAKIEIEFDLTKTRLEFSGMGRPLVINPRECKGDASGKKYPSCSSHDKHECREDVDFSTFECPTTVPLSRMLDESGDYAASWYAFWEEDCMDPPIWIVRADSFEQAYEDFCNEAIEPLDEATLADYTRNEEGDYDDLTLTEKGWISTEATQGREICLVSAEVL